MLVRSPPATTPTYTLSLHDALPIFTLGRCIAEGDLVVVLQLGKGIRIGEEIAIHMGDREADNILITISANEEIILRGDLQVNIAADEFLVGVAQQRARQETGLGHHLKAVADRNDRRAGGGLFDNLAHDR